MLVKEIKQKNHLYIYIYRKMATYLNTNWTDKIKTNPVANKILNSNKTTIRPVVFHYVHEYDRNSGRLAEDRDAAHRADVDLKKWDIFKQNNQTNRQLVERIMDKRNATREERQQHYNNTGKDWPEAAKDNQWGMLPAWTYYADEDGDYDEHNVTIQDYWSNVYVKDFINIDHPKLRPCYVSAMSRNPLQIKPPSVFFSDV